MGTEWEPQRQPKPPKTPADEATQIVAAILIIGVGIGVFFGLLWVFNAMVDAHTIH